MIKLSIIIPVYNVELYVEKCLRSCAEQDLPPDEYEIIVINDGTPDSSLEIVERVAKDYSNISIYSQENRGLSAARNKGLSLAKGEYVWFVDSDDWIGDNFLKKMTDTLFNDKLDGMIIKGVRYINGDVFYRSDFQNADIVMSGHELIKNITFNCIAVGTIYSRSFLENNNLKFLEGVYHEDLEFTPRAYYFIKRIAFKNYDVYFNRLNPESITQVPNPKRALDLIDVANSLMDFRDNVVLKELWIKYNTFASAAINSALNITLEIDEASKLLVSKKLFKNRKLFTVLINSSVLKYKLEGLLFKLFPRYTVKLFSILKKAQL